MGTVPVNPVMIDVLDSFYGYIVTQMQKLNPARQFKGIVNAQDWPQAEITEESLYLLYLTSVPLQENSTRAQTYYEHFVQWAWIIIGNDLQGTQVGLNRGNRYRDSMAIEEELRQVHFPGFAPKQFVTVDLSTGVVTYTPYSPVEMIHWSEPKLGVKMANTQSGLLYGTSPLQVYGWSGVNPLLNV